MKAVILKGFGGVENFEMAEVPLPPLGVGQVLIRIKAVSFNPVDYQVRKGGPEKRHLVSNILGRDLSGVVEAVAPDVKEFQEGDEVVSYVCNLAAGGQGTYAEYVSVPSVLVAKKPVSLSHEEAASVPVAGITAMLALTKAQAASASSIFIAGGAGGVGTFALLLAPHMGFKTVITSAGSEKSRSYLLRELGLNENQILDYTREDFVEMAAERNGGPFSVVLDLVGGRMMSACCELAAIDGHVISVVDPPVYEDFDKLFLKNASFHTIGANAYSLSPDRRLWMRYRALLERFSELFDGGAIRRPPVRVVGPLSDQTVKLAHTMLESGSVQGKLVMTC